MALPLQRLYTAGALLADRDGDGICDTVRAKVLWDAAAETEVLVASLAIVARLALHAIALHEPLAMWNHGPAHAECPIHITGRKERHPVDAADQVIGGSYGVIASGQHGLAIRGNSTQATAQAARYLARGYPYLDHQGPSLARLLDPEANVLRLYVDGDTAALKGLLLASERPPSFPERDGWTCRNIEPQCYLMYRNAVSGHLPSRVALPDRRAHLSAHNSADLPAQGWNGQLKDLYRSGGFWYGRDGVTPQLMRTCLVLESFDHELMISVAGLVARLAMEASEVLFPVAALLPPPESDTARLLFYVREHPGVKGARLVPTASSLCLQYSHAAARERALVDLARWPSPWTATAAENWEESRDDQPTAEPSELDADEVFTWDFRWEGEILLTELEKALARIPPDVHLEIEAGVWEGQAVRQQLAAQMEACLRAHKRSGSVHVTCSFKRALFWIKEEVLPLLTPLRGQIASIVIDFPWEAAEEEKLDLPIRWLQELYPIDEILAAALGLAPDCIRFCAQEGSTYRLHVYSHQGDVLWLGTQPLVTAPVLYLKEPRGRYGEVSQCWLRLYAVKSGRLLHEHRFSGDAQRFWERYRDEFLPHLQAQLNERHDPKYPMPPLAALDVQVWMSQPEEELGVDQERVSPAEALHQDIYFGTLEACRLQGTPHPGPVRPWLHQRPYQGTRAILTVRWQRQTHRPVSIAQPLAYIWPLQGRVHGLSADGDKIAAPTPIVTPAPKPEHTTLPVVPRDRVLGVEETIRLVKGLSAHRLGHAYEVARSYQGREVWALELSSMGPGPLLSRYKLSFFKPTCLIQARKHANEVSSTQANLEVARQLLEGELSGLLKKVNVVLIPFANPDGGALHYAMQEEHPFWKLHAARFNAAGMDIYQHHHQPDTPFGESRVYPRLWQRWLPDLSLDDHGVPTHEWLHLFGGYNSPPSFGVSYWLPHSHLYAILLCHEKERGPWRAVQEDFRRSLVRAFHEHPWLMAANRRRRRRHEKYARAWLAEPFSLEVHDEVVFYTWPVKKHRTLEQYPHLTYIECITEVTDETAQGTCLEQAQKAHYVFDSAAIRWLAQQGASRIELPKEECP